MAARQRERNRRTVRDEVAGSLSRAGGACLLAVALLLSYPCAPARAQAASGATTPRLNETTPDFAGSSQSIIGFGLTSSAQPIAPNGPSKPFSEVLRGNGTGIGYMLTHGGILADTVSVHVGVNRLKPGTDYWLDPVNGTLTFAQSIRSFETVDVYYRYVEGQDAQRQPLSLPGLQLAFGSATNLNLFYGMTPGNGSGLNSSLFGLALNSKFGAGGLSNYSGLLYFSNTQKSDNMVTLSPDRSAPQSATPPKTGASDLILQNLATKVGGLAVHASFQDVGKDFAGFQALRLGNANNKAMLDQLGQLEKEKGLQRLGFGFGTDPNSKRAAQGFQLDLNQINDSTGTTRASFLRDSLALHAGSLQIKFLNRAIDPNFTRLGDLTDAEKNDLALDLRREFDPSATLEQVTQKDREQVLKEAGLARTALEGRFQLGKNSQDGLLSFQDFTISGQPVGAPSSATPALGAIHRMAIGFEDKRLHFLLADQSIADSFTRLGDLSDLERAQFGNAHGLQSHQLTFSYQFDKKTHLSFDSLSVGATADVLANAIAAAKQAGTDPQAAAQAAASRLSRQNFQFETPGLKFAANSIGTDKSFTRVSDLALPDADKHEISTDLGFAHNDYTLHFDRIKGLTLDSYFYNATDSLDSLAHSIDKQNFLYAPNKRMSLSFTRNSDLASTGGKASGTTTNQLALDQNFGKGVLLKLYHDDNTTLSDGIATQDASTDLLHFETDKSKPNALLFENKQVQYMEGKYENTVNLNVHVKPARQLTVSYSKQDIDRGADPSLSTDAFDFQWQATKQFAVVGGVSQIDTNNNTNGGTVSVGLQGQPVKNVTLAAKFDEAHQDTVDTKNAADISICNAKPFSFGPFKEMTITARYAALNDQRKLQNETMTGRIAWKLWKNEFLIDYNGLTQANGMSTIARTYSFTTDPNPQKRFHASFLYKARDMLDGTQNLTRRFTADWKIARTTSFVYNYGTLPEDDKGVLTPLETADVELKHALRPDLTTSLYYRLNDNKATKIMTRGLGFSLEGTLNKQNKLTLAYSAEANGYPDRFDHSNYFRIQFDHQVSTDRYLTLWMDYRTHDGTGLANELQGNLDYRLNF